MTDQPPEIDQRLSQDEIEAIRNRLTHGGLDPIDIRSHGATTVGDVAEALGVSPSDVQAHLDHWRAEKALAGELKKPADQKRLAALAGVLFATAAGIAFVRIHGFENVAMQTRWLRSEIGKNLRPKYPPRNINLSLGSEAPPLGLTLRMEGVYTVTTAKGAPDTKPWRVDNSIKQLAASLEVFGTKAWAAEKTYSDFLKKTGKGKTPNPVGVGGSNPPQGAMNLSFANLQTQVMFEAPPASPNARSFIGNGMDSKFDPVGIATDYVKNIYMAENAKPQGHRSPGERIYPPFGFSVCTIGRVNVVNASPGEMIFPVNANLFRDQLDASCQQVLRDAEKPPYHFAGTWSRHLAIPPFTVIEISFLGKKIHFETPTAPSPKYPTAADVLRGANAVIKKNVSKVVDIINELNKQSAEG